MKASKQADGDGWIQADKSGKHGASKAATKKPAGDPIYYGLKVHGDLLSILESLAAKDVDSEQPRLPKGKVDDRGLPEADIPTTLKGALDVLKDRSRVERGVDKHHVTLVFMGGGKKLQVSPDRARIMDLAKTYAGRIDELVTLSFSRILWNHQVVAIPIDLPENVPCVNAHPHVTLGTFSEAIKPVVSGEFLGNVLDRECDYFFEYECAEPVELQSSVFGFYGR